MTIVPGYRAKRGTLLKLARAANRSQVQITLNARLIVAELLELYEHGELELVPIPYDRPVEERELEIKA